MNPRVSVLKIAQQAILDFPSGDESLWLTHVRREAFMAGAQWVQEVAR